MWGLFAFLGGEGWKGGGMPFVSYRTRTRHRARLILFKHECLFLTSHNNTEFVYDIPENKKGTTDLISTFFRHTLQGLCFHVIRIFKPCLYIYIYIYYSRSQYRSFVRLVHHNGIKTGQRIFSESYGKGQDRTGQDRTGLVLSRYVWDIIIKL